MASSYLELPPEWGGIKYGPFRGTIAIGSDAKRCALALDPQLGIHPTHVSLVPDGARSYRLELNHPDAGVFLKRAGEQQMFPVRTATSVSCGDTLVLGTPSGPPFTVQNDAPIAADVSANAAAGLGGRLGQEMKRQGMARLLSKAGPFRDAYHMWNRASSGGYSNPTFLVGALLGLVTAILAGGASCSGLAYVLYQNLTP